MLLAQGPILIEQRFLEFMQKCAAIWREQPVLQRRNFFVGRAIRGSEVKDISFFEPSGKDLLADAAGAALGIWVLHPLLGGGKSAKDGAKTAEIAVTPTLGAGAYGLRVHASF